MNKEQKTLLLIAAIILVQIVFGIVATVSADALTEEDQTRSQEVAESFSKALLLLEPSIRATADRIVLSYEDYDGKVFCVSLKPDAGKKLSTWRKLSELTQGVTVARSVKECGTISGFSN